LTMGNTNHKVRKELVDMYQLLTFFTKMEIRDCYKSFSAMLPPDQQELDSDQQRIYHEDLKAKVEELGVNPFGDRILQVFSDDKPYMEFEDFLNMMSIMSPKCPTEVKAKWAFKVYDFDSDGYINGDDIKQVIRRITSQDDDSEIEPPADELESESDNDYKDMSDDKAIPEEVLNVMVNKVLNEIDLNNNGYITTTEFELVAIKSPEFIHSFKIEL